jgi:hypothetical protein
MTDTNHLVEALDRELLSWDGVSKGEGRFSSTAYLLGRREIGHIHTGRTGGVADFGFPRAVRDELMATGRAEPHHAGIRGAVSHRLREAGDLPGVIALFRLNYERLQAPAGTTQGATDGIGPDDTETG